MITPTNKPPGNDRDKRLAGPQDDPAFLARFKEFGPASYAIDHTTSVMVLLMMVTIAGILTYRAIPKESSPEIEIPIIAVNTIYPGVAPSDMETLVTRKLEEELNTIADIKELRSTSIEGYSSITAEFETSVNMDEALQQVREKVDLAKPELPEDAEDPQILEFDLSEQPIMQVNLSGQYGLVRLKEIGEELQDRLEQIPEVLRVDFRGGLEREVQVNVNLAKLQFYNVAIGDVIEAVRTENVNIPGGSIDVGDMKYLVRVDGEFDDPSVIGDLVVSTEAGRPIYVRDIAEVEFGFAERETYARLDGTPVVTLDIIKRSGRNIIETAVKVKGVISEMDASFPPTTVIKITSDESENIEDMVNSLENNIVSGLILIVGVLLFFLGLRTSVFVAISIPTSMFLSFLVLGLVGVTMNMVVLFSLILALGMLVDNAIVVVENIYRYVEHGWDRKLAAKKATGEVAMPVIVATLTTVAAFAPLIFWPGIVGEFMKYLPMTLIITLSSSLFVGLVIVPALCSMYMRPENEPRPPLTRDARVLIGVAGGLVLAVVLRVNPLSAALMVATVIGLVAIYKLVLEHVGHTFAYDLVPAVVQRYETALRWSLDRRWVVVGGSFAVLIGSFMLFASFSHGVEYFPEDIPPAAALVRFELPTGSRAQASNRIALRLEDELAGVPGVEDTESVVATVGGGGQGGGGGESAGRVTVNLVDYQDRSHDAFETLAAMQSMLGSGLAGAEISVDQPSQGPPGGPPVSIEIAGENPGVLKDLSDQVLNVLRNSAVSQKLVGLESDMDAARPELSVQVDRERAALYGLSTLAVGNAIRGAIQGVEAAKYRVDNDEYDIIVRLREQDRAELTSLADLTVMDDGTQVPLLSVARWTVSEGYGSILRKDMDRMATITADVGAGLNANAVFQEVQTTLRDFQASLPPGYTVSYAGQSEDQAEAQAFLTKAFLIALALIALILISQFNSVVKPVIILTSVLMSTSGVLLGLIVFNMPFVIIMTGLGLISLAGIVVNNAIVLMDYIDILRSRDGMDRKEALVQGGKTRFRPVVLTAITTAFGLIPLAVGLNFDFFGLYRSLNPSLYWGGEQAAWWGPMAIAVIAGIIFATFLTLILVPVLYSLVDDMSLFFRGHFTHELDGVEHPEWGWAHRNGETTGEGRDGGDLEETPPDVVEEPNQEPEGEPSPAPGEPVAPVAPVAPVYAREREGPAGHGLFRPQPEGS